MGYTPISDHASRALARLPTQFQDDQDPAALLNCLVAQVQEVEDAFATLIRILNYAQQTGDALGQIAQTVNLGPQPAGESDPNFRADITTQIDINKSQATCADVLATARAVALKIGIDPTHLDFNESGAGDTGNYQPQGGFQLETKPQLDGTGSFAETITRASAVLIWRAAKAAAGAGIRVRVKFRPVGLEASGSAFRFGGGGGGIETASGFGAGKLCGAVSSE